MSQWPNFQEYNRNLGSQSVCRLNEAITDKEGKESESGDEIGGGSRGGERFAEPPKTVRCVIDKDFGESLIRLGSGDYGGGAPQQPQQQQQQQSGVRGAAKEVASAVDSLRLKNHLEWKRQKETEYLRKKEAERLEEQRKREEKLRDEKEKRRKEKEREEKMREWQEQKAREKEERKREEMVLKALEQEIKGVTQTIDKEKLIHEWIRLKNKQKQLEAEKKAELIRKEEETRALRQSLAEISYRQWKERTKTRRISLPKNGYQIFGPKPVPVVKEDWNHDFAKGDAQDKGFSSRTPKSTVSMTSIRVPSLSRTELAPRRGLLCGDIKKKSPSSCHLKVTRSKTSLNDYGEALPFDELKIPEADLATRWKNMEDFLALRQRGSDARRPGRNKKESESSNDEAPHVKLPNGFAALGAASRLVNASVADIAPNKSKLDIYLQGSESEYPAMAAMAATADKPKKSKGKIAADENLKRYLQGRALSDVESKLLINLNEKLSSSQIKGGNASNNATKKTRDASDANRKTDGVAAPNATEATNRRSRSYDKPFRKFAASERHPSRSTSVTATDKTKKAVAAAAAAAPQSKPSGKQTEKPSAPSSTTLKPTDAKKQRKLTARRKLVTPNPVAGDGGGVVEKQKTKSESEAKSRRKAKKAPKPEPAMLADSPYYKKKSRGKIKSTNRAKKDDKDAGQTWKEGKKDD